MEDSTSTFDDSLEEILPEMRRTLEDSFVVDSSHDEQKSKATLKHAVSVFARTKPPKVATKVSGNNQRGATSAASVSVSAGKQRFSLAPMAISAFTHTHHDEKNQHDKTNFVFSDTVPKKKHDKQEETETPKKKHSDDAPHKLKGMVGIMKMRAVLGHAKNPVTELDSEHNGSHHDSASFNSDAFGDVLMDFPTNRDELLEFKEKERIARGGSVDEEEPLELEIEANQRKPWMKLMRDLDDFKSSDDENIDMAFLPNRANTVMGKHSTEELLYMIGFDFENAEFHGTRHPKAESVNSRTTNDTTITDLRRAQHALGWNYADVRSDYSDSITNGRESNQSHDRTSSPLLPYKKEISLFETMDSQSSLKSLDEIVISPLSTGNVQKSTRHDSPESQQRGIWESGILPDKSMASRPKLPSSPTGQSLTLGHAPPETRLDGKGQNVDPPLIIETADVRVQVASRLFGAGLAKLAKKAEETRKNTLPTRLSGPPIQKEDPDDRSNSQKNSNDDTDTISESVRQKVASLLVLKRRSTDNVEALKESGVPQEPDHPELEGMAELFAIAKIEGEKSEERQVKRRSRSRRNNQQGGGNESQEGQRRRRNDSKNRRRHRHRHHDESSCVEGAEREGVERRHRHRSRRRRRDREEGKLDDGDDCGENKRTERSRRHREQSRNGDKFDEGEENREKRKRHRHRSHPREKEGILCAFPEGNTVNKLEEEKHEEGHSSVGTTEKEVKLSNVSPFKVVDTEAAAKGNHQGNRNDKSLAANRLSKAKNAADSIRIQSQTASSLVSGQGKNEKQRLMLGKETPKMWRNSSNGSGAIANSCQEQSFSILFDDTEASMNSGKTVDHKKKDASTNAIIQRCPSVWAKRWIILAGIIMLFIILIIAISVAKRN